MRSNGQPGWYRDDQAWREGIHQGGLHLLKEKRFSDILVFGGGTIPKKDLEKLKSLGIGEIFTTGTDTHAIIDYLNRTLER